MDENEFPDTGVDAPDPGDALGQAPDPDTDVEHDEGPNPEDPPIEADPDAVAPLDEDGENA
jgi:hypothetical protein